MLARVNTAAIVGIEARMVEVQLDVCNGLPAVRTLGLPDSSIRESADRVRPAMLNSGFRFPARRITINLAPADLPKVGSSYDLPVALGIIAADHPNQETRKRLERYLWVGELTLEGAVRPVRGILPIAIAARKQGLDGLVCAPGVAEQAALVAGIEARIARTLREAFAFADELVQLPVAEPPADGAERNEGSSGDTTDLEDVRGQATGRRALEIAAAGRHNLLFVGPPGAGKTMLARRLPGILPPLSPEEALDVTCLYSVAGLLAPGAGLIRRPPFRAPHHSATSAAIAGGGPGPRPGEASLASRGVLFLDELPEFSRLTLETLRQPIEEGQIRLVRARSTVVYPARFQLVAAMNPCPCGYLGDGRRPCDCNPARIGQYMARVSGPLLDRIDLQVWLPAVAAGELAGGKRGEPTSAVRGRVRAARERQKARGHGLNGELSQKLLESSARLDPAGEALLTSAIDRLGLSARAYHRVLRVARTIADLAESERILPPHVAEAIQYRILDREESARSGAGP